MRLPVSVGFDLKVRIGEEAAPLSPRQGLRLAEVLIRRSCRAMLAEEIRSSRTHRPVSRGMGAAGIASAEAFGSGGLVQSEPRRPRPAASRGAPS
jgi:hypothetical protein